MSARKLLRRSTPSPHARAPRTIPATTSPALPARRAACARHGRGRARVHVAIRAVRPLPQLPEAKEAIHAIRCKGVVRGVSDLPPLSGASILAARVVLATTELPGSAAPQPWRAIQASAHHGAIQASAMCKARFITRYQEAGTHTPVTSRCSCVGWTCGKTRGRWRGTRRERLRDGLCTV